MHIPTSKLKDLLINAGLLTEVAFQEAMEESQRTNVFVENVLIGQGKVNEKYFAEALAEYLKLPLYHFDPEKISTDVFRLIPESIAKWKNVFVVGREDGRIKVAMVDPRDFGTVNFLEAKLQFHIDPVLVSHGDFSELLKLYKKDIKKEFQQIIDEETKKIAASSSAKATDLAAEVPVINILNTILEHAAANRASDIHIEGSLDTVVIRYRIDGVLHDIVELPAVLQSAFIARIKILAQLQIDEHRTPQDGRFKYQFEDAEIAVRVSVMPTLHGEKAALRLLASTERPLNLTELGATGHNLDILSKCILRANGLIIVTGPTGCGKTTTLYTVLALLNKPEVNIATIEDPIEYDIARVNQTQVNEKTGLTFGEGLRAFLRQNPDILMIGEIRDKETAELAIHASLTGHLVLSTLHTDDAASTVPRLVDLGAQPFLLASTLRTVLAQRLVRKICAQCATTKPVTDEVKNLIFEQLNRSNKYRTQDFVVPTALYFGAGCTKCAGSGFHGQIGIFEIFEVTPEIADLILARTSAEIVKDTALQQGMVTMFEDGLQKVERGITTMEEVFRVTRV